MAENTAIAWTDHTWNPWQGCHKVSMGCDNCYMYREKKRYGQDPAKIIRSANRTFTFPYRLDPHVPAKIFVCSWSDFFLPEADEWRWQAWEIIRSSPPGLVYQILTKRPENIMARLPLNWGKGWPNVWLGVTVENQEMADLRIPILLQIPAAIRFVSIEPMLGSIDLQQIRIKQEPHIEVHNALSGYSTDTPYGYIKNKLPDPFSRGKLDWVICGGETGPKARPMHPYWVRSIRDKCQADGTPFFFKQWGEWWPSGGMGLLSDEHHGFTWLTWDGQQYDSGCSPDELMFRVGKKAAGDFLDGRQWHEFPQVSG